MYTIIVNDDKSLTTSVKTTILRNTSTDEIQILWNDPNKIVPSEASDVPVDPSEDEEPVNPTVTVEKVYTGLLRYETDDIAKTESLVTDPEFYKERVRFTVPRSAAFFSNRGLIKLWIEIAVDTITTTTTTIIDPETGIETTETTTETVTEEFETTPTTLFIEEVPHRFRHHKEDNTIRITRGDSLTVNVVLTDNDGFPYEPVEGDEVWFTVKKSANSADVLIRKSIDITNLVLDLVESDTENLAFGEFRYEIEVVTCTNDHYTVIKNAPFIITEELH